MKVYSSWNLGKLKVIHGEGGGVERGRKENAT